MGWCIHGTGWIPVHHRCNPLQGWPRRLKVETDICIHCDKPIYFGPEDTSRPGGPNFGVKQLRYWRHTETRIGVCGWDLPIIFAKPKSGQLAELQMEFLERNKLLSRHKIWNEKKEWVFGWDQMLLSYFLQVHDKTLSEEENPIVWLGGADSCMYEVEELVRAAKIHGLEIDSDTQKHLYAEKDEGN